jgi:hypothetical protein
MAKKVSKNQRTARGGGAEQKQMAKVIVSARKANGNYEFRQKMVEVSRVQEELQAVRG